MQRFRFVELPVLGGALAAALVVALLAPAGDVAAQRRPARGTLDVHVTTGACGTCAMPPGRPRPAPAVAVRVFRENRRRVRTQVSARLTDSAGVAHFTLRPGRYCVEPDAPAVGPEPQNATGSDSHHCDTRQ